MGANVEFRDIESILEAFRMYETPYFSIWQGNNLKFCYEENDIADAERLLEQNLRYIESSNTTAVYTLKAYKTVPITNKSPYKGSFTFKLDDRDIQKLTHSENGQPVYVINGNNRTPAPPVASSIESKLDKLIELITLQIQANAAAPVEEYDDDEEEEEEPDEHEILQKKVETYTQIGSMIADKFMPIVGMIIDRFAPKPYNQPQYQQPQQIAGFMPQEQPEQGNQLQAAIQKIVACVGDAAFCNAMYKLAQMAETEPAKLKGLINML